MDSIESAKSPTLARLIYALGIRHVGERTAELIADRFGTLENLRKASLEEISGIHDVGPVAGASVRAWLDEEHNQLVLQKLQQHGVVPQTSTRRVVANSELAGKSFVFHRHADNEPARCRRTGKEHGRRVSRQRLQENRLCCGGEDAGSKAERARELGVTILSEDEFKKLLGTE
jgi:DNA ligase (NAD+)